MSRDRVSMAGLVLAAGSLLLITAGPPAAHPVTASQAPGKPGKPSKPAQARDPANQTTAKKGPDSTRPDGSGRAERPRRKPDRRPPMAPTLGGAWTGAGGAISVPVSAEAGSQVEIRERGELVASGTGSSTYTWWTSTGSHAYLVTATDASGNRSGASRFTITADATPPSLSRVQAAVGDRRDSRSRLTFLTDPGSAYRVVVDGKVVGRGSDPDARVARFLDVRNGRHRVLVEVRDAVGNVASWTGSFRVRIPMLGVATRVIGDPTERVQRLRIEATPNATRGVLVVPGQGRERFRFLRGRAAVRLPLADGTYRGVTVTVFDGQGRTGSQTLRAIRVDTTPPEIDVRVDRGAAAEGRLRATVISDPGATIEWRLLDGTGAVVGSGSVVAASEPTTLERDVEEADYRLAVSATDEFDRSTATAVAAAVAADPWSDAVTALAVAGLVGAGLGLAVAMVPLVPRLLRLVARRRAWLAARRVERHQRRLDDLAVDDEEPAAIPAPAAVMPQQRRREDAVARLLGLVDDGTEPSILGSGLSLLEDERILHATTGQLFETADADSEELVLHGHVGEVAVTNRRIVFVGDVTRDWWEGLVDGLNHVDEDKTLLRRWREDTWSGLVYDDPDVTRLYVDMLVAEQRGHRYEYLARLEEELHGAPSAPVVGGRD